MSVGDNHNCLKIKLLFTVIESLPGTDITTHFTAVIYCLFILVYHHCVIQLHYLGNYHGMAVNYHGKMRVNYRGILNLEKVGFYYLGNLPWYCFITLAPGPYVTKLFTAVIYCHSMVIMLFCVIKLYCLGD